jgi:hypothetical protein
VVGLLLLAVGAYIILIQSPKQEREWRRIEAFQELDKARYAAVPPGEQVVLTGRLQDNSTRTRYELVAFEVHEWDVSTDDEGDESGSWRTLEVNVPALVLSIQGGVIKTIAATPSMGGEMHEFIEPTYSRTTATYKNRSLSDGSIRVRGFRNRDLVTVVGRKTADGDLQPERLHGGDRPSLVAVLRGNVLALRILGGVLMLIGVVALVILARFA